MSNSLINNGLNGFNQWTGIYNDSCSYENQLRMASKPMKYYVNTLNSPEADPFMRFTEIGNQQAYGVRNDMERPQPSRLNGLQPSRTLPYSTTPFLGAQNPNSQKGFADVAYAAETGVWQDKSGQALPGIPQDSLVATSFPLKTEGRNISEKFFEGQFQVVDPQTVQDWNHINDAAFSGTRGGIDTYVLMKNVSQLNNYPK